VKAIDNSAMERNGPSLTCTLVSRYLPGGKLIAKYWSGDSIPTWTRFLESRSSNSKNRITGRYRLDLSPVRNVETRPTVKLSVTSAGSATGGKWVAQLQGPKRSIETRAESTHALPLVKRLEIQRFA
jgi:hypothetical protein